MLENMDRMIELLEAEEAKIDQRIVELKNELNRLNRETTVLYEDIRSMKAAKRSIENNQHLFKIEEA